jgi:hypothetical protein
MKRKEGFWQLWRRDLPSMTSNMMPVLQFLREAKQQGWAFQLLVDVNKKTRRVLTERDWIFESKGPDGLKYAITERGLNALKVYEPVLKRDDGICPTCNEQPVHYYSTGRKAGYCKECLCDLARRRYKRAGNGIRQDRMCSRCRKFPVHVRPSGRAITYCMHCKNVLGRRQKKRMHRRNIKRIQNGEFLKCGREGCNEPRYHSENTVYDWCHQHYREYINDYMHRKNAGKPAGKIGRPKKVIQ